MVILNVPKTYQSAYFEILMEDEDSAGLSLSHMTFFALFLIDVVERPISFEGVCLNAQNWDGPGLVLVYGSFEMKLLQLVYNHILYKQ